jgi:hypothetical protein
MALKSLSPTVCQVTTPADGKFQEITIDAAALVWSVIPWSKLIWMWSGTLASMPAGFQLCDGTNGTPDLRQKFIKGVNTGVDPGGTGGAATHSHGVGTLADTAASAGTPAGTIAWPAGVPTTAWPANVPTFTGSALGTHTHGTGTYAVAAHTGGTSGSGTGTTFTRFANSGDKSHTLSGSSAAVSAGTPAGTIAWPANPPTVAWPAGVPVFTGTALGTHAHGLTGNTATASSEPDYYELAFIMKVS